MSLLNCLAAFLAGLVLTATVAAAATSGCPQLSHGHVSTLSLTVWSETRSHRMFTPAVRLILPASGSAKDRIRLCGSGGAVLDGGNVAAGTVLSVKGSHRDIRRLVVTNGAMGVVLDAA